MSKIVKSDSKDYRATFYGILNAQGNFWTPLAFETEAKARDHIVNFWGSNTANRDKCLRTHKIVPVRVRLETLPEDRRP